MSTPWGTPGSRRERAGLYSVLFVMGADMFSLPMLLPAIAAQFDASVAQAAVIVVAFGVTYALCSAPVSCFLRGHAHHTVISAGLALATTASFAGALAPSLTMLVLARAVCGMGAAIANPAVWSCLDANATRSPRGRVMLTGTAISAAGQTAGIPAGAMLGASGHWRTELIIMASAMLGAWIAVRCLVGRQTPPGSAGRGAPWRDLAHGLRLWRDRVFTLTVLANISAQAARLGSYSFAAVLLIQRYDIAGTALVGIGMIAGTGSLTGAVCASVLIAHWLGHGRTALSFAIAWMPILLCGMLLFTMPVGSPLGLIGLALSFAAGTVIFGSTQLHIASRFRQDRTAVAFNSSAMYVGAAVGTFVLGHIPVRQWFTVATLAFVLISLAAAAWANSAGKTGDTL